MQITWFLNDAGAGFAMLLLGIGVAIQSFKKRNNTITP